MRLEEVAPDSITYVCGLKACGSLRAIDRGQEIHAGIVKEGLKSDLLVVNTLVDMYAKCGSLEEAQKVFDELCFRDVVTWTALISGYAEYGLSEEALNCLEQMELEGIHWDPVVFVSGLKASGSLGAVNRGQKIHAEIVKQGFENISFVGSTLVGMYAKCGLFVEAHEVLDTLPIRDAVSWNALISGYAEHGCGEKSLDSFEQMQLEGVSQDPVTYLSSLKACGDVGDLQRGQAIHGQITKTGFGRDATIGNMLVYMYVKCDSFLEAWEVFDELPVQDVVSWTSLIAGYADRGFGEDALDILEQMQLNGVSTDNVAFLCGLKTCGSIGASGRGREIHVEIVKKGFDRNPLVGNTLVDMYAKCGLLVETHQVFHELSVQDLVSWNALIAGYAEQGLGEEALECFEKMQLKNMSPDAVTFVGILKACGSPEAIHRGLTLHAAVVKQGLERDHIVGNALVEMYAKCSPLKVAHEIFYKMPVGDVVSWNTLIGLYVEQGLHEEALACFQQMQFKGISPDRVSWSGLILAYAEQGESEKAVNFYAQMQGQSLTPDNTVLLSVLKACVNTAMMEMGRRIHAQVARLETMEVNLATAFIDMYGRCGSMTDAQQLFDAMRMRDLVTWDALIRGYARQGDTERVFHLFETLMEEGLQPDDVMFLTVLSLCMHVGLVEKAHKYFEIMSKDYGLTPSIKHFTCMIDLLGRAGQLDEAVRLVEKMPFQPNLVVWHTMLGACQKWGNTELGRWAFEHAVGLDRRHATAYVLMSNIYVDAHMWEEATEIEAMRMEMQKVFMSSCPASSNAGGEEDSLIPPF